jgi:hypothetical protein
MKPVKTEYMGVVFDSKSEAVFARTLHLLGHEYVYHPNEHCGHVWDFLVFRKPFWFYRSHAIVGDTCYWSTNQYYKVEAPILVEYKPNAPTKTYIDNLTNKMREDPIESVIVWGNPWSGPDNKVCLDDKLSYVCYPVFTKHDRFGWGDFNQLADNGYDDVPFSYRHTFSEMFYCHTERFIQEAKSYRFDLRNNYSA